MDLKWTDQVMASGAGIYGSHIRNAMAAGAGDAVHTRADRGAR